MFQVTNLTMPNRSSFMNYALKSILGVADVGDPHECEDGPTGPRTPPRCLEGVWKKLMTNFTMPNSLC